MRAEKVVRALLDASTEVQAIVEGRVWGGNAPQKAAAPLLIYRKLSAQRDAQLDRDEFCIVDAQIEILCIAKTYPALKELAEAVRVALAWVEGVDDGGSPSAAIAGVSVLGILITDEGPDEYDPDLDEHGQSWIFTVKHIEP